MLELFSNNSGKIKTGFIGKEQCKYGQTADTSESCNFSR